MARFQREECTLKFDGPTIHNHEMDIAILANELLAFQNAVEQANTFLNGKKTLLSIKVKGGFVEGSLEAKVVVDYISAILPAVPDVLNSLTELIKFKQFLKGEPPQEVKPMEGGFVQVTNSQNVNISINNMVVNINNSAKVNTALGKFLDPLGGEVGSISIVNGSDENNHVAVQADEKPILMPAIEDLVEERVSERELEILSSQVDGKAIGWRFFDLEENSEFTASIGDKDFLSQVTGKRYNFQNGDRIKVVLSETKYYVNERKRTERVVIEVLSYLRPDSK